MTGADADPPTGADGPYATDGSTGADGSTAAAADPGPPAHDPFVPRVAAVLALTTATVVLAALAVIGSSVLLAAFGGVLLAIILAACADAIERRSPLSYSWALATVVALSLAVLAATGWLLGAQLAAQVDEFARMLPRLVADIESYLGRRGWGRWLLELVEDTANDAAEDGMAGLAAVGRLTRVSTYLLVAVFVGLFGAANPRLYRDGIVSLTPIRHRERMRELLREIGYTLRRWLLGQAISMVVIGVSTTLLLLAFGMPLAIVLGLIVGVLGFIPYLGPIIGAVPVALVAGAEGTTMLVYVLATYTVVQMLEGYVITPMIFQRTVYLPPVFTIIMQVLLGVALGPGGFVLATPIAAVLLVLSRFYRRHILGDRDIEVHRG